MCQNQGSPLPQFGCSSPTRFTASHARCATTPSASTSANVNRKLASDPASLRSAVKGPRYALSGAPR